MKKMNPRNKKKKKATKNPHQKNPNPKSLPQNLKLPPRQRARRRVREGRPRRRNREQGEGKERPWGGRLGQRCLRRGREMFLLRRGRENGLRRRKRLRMWIWRGRRLLRRIVCRGMRKGMLMLRGLLVFVGMMREMLLRMRSCENGNLRES